MQPYSIQPSSFSQAIVPLEQVSSLTVRQQVEWAEVIVGWETRNRYQVLGPSGEPLLYAGELGGGLGSVVMRGFLKNKRPFSMELRSAAGDVFLRLNRPWRWFFSTLEIFDGSGTLVGSIQQRFRFFTRHYEVLAPDGQLLATLEGPFFKPWTFIAKIEGREVGKIQKKWSGLGKEIFSKADNFNVELGPGLETLQLRQLVVGATFLIDFVHFENAG